MNKNKNWWLIKIDRVFAWILLVSMFFYFLTGYGMTKKIINSIFASKLHLDILPLVIMVAFAVHTFLAVRLAFMRWKIWNKTSMIVLVLIYLSFLIGFGYIEIFYKNNKTEESIKTTSEQNVENSSQDQSATQTSSQAQPESTEKVFTISELAKYNGQNGMPAYVAVDGVVYELSTVFINGGHYSHFAGQELTNAFYREHAKSQISKYPVVGILK